MLLIFVNSAYSFISDVNSTTSPNCTATLFV